MIELDLPIVMEYLDKAVAERGADFTYVRIPVPSSCGVAISSRCLYVDASSGERRPSCIIGMAFYLAGVPLERLAALERNGPAGLLRLLADQGVVTWTGTGHEQVAAGSALGTAQISQDAGDTWGRAQAEAQASLARFGYDPSGRRLP